MNEGITIIVRLRHYLRLTDCLHLLKHEINHDLSLIIGENIERRSWRHNSWEFNIVRDDRMFFLKEVSSAKYS